MCVVVAPTLVRRALDLQTAARRRARCLRGAAVNAAVLLALTADLSWKCEGYTSALHWVEMALAGVAGANLLRLALLLARPTPPPLPLRPHQRRLLALTDPDLDSSFRLEEPSAVDSVSSLSMSLSASGGSAGAGGSACAGAGGDLSLSLSPARAWRAEGASGAGMSRSPSPSPEHSPSTEQSAPPRDRFIADRRSLADYLQQYESRQQAAEGGMGVAAGGGVRSSPGAVPGARYQLASREEGDGGPGAEGGGVGGGVGAEAGGGSALAAAARRLHLDPTRLAEYNLNLRVWLHVTILERLVREIDSVESALGRLGLGAALAEWPVERLRALATAPHSPPALAQVLPYVQPWAARHYVVRRVRALAKGGALSAYRGALPVCAPDTGGAPTDAELLLHLFATYLDGQLPAPPARPFSATFLTRAPAPPAQPLALHLTSGAGCPPHYVVCVRGAALDVCHSARSNLLHALLVFLAAAARLHPPPLRAPHLGPAALNLLWVIGR